MSTEYEQQYPVTFARAYTNFTRKESIHIDDNESRSDVISSASSRNLSSASFKPPRRQQRATQFNTQTTSGQIDLDAEFKYDSDEDVVLEKYGNITDQHKRMYTNQCKHQGVLAYRKVLNQFGKTTFDISDLNLSSRELKPICTVLINGVDIVEIDCSGNTLGVKDISYISEILKANESVKSLTMRRCGLQGEPIRYLSEFLSKNTNLRQLDISENRFDDKDAPYVANIIEHNESIHSLNLSQNRLGDSGLIIGNALRENITLSTLDLSWNHIRGNGAIGLAKGLENNSKLLHLKVAWNGFAFEGCAALGHTLMHNSTLVAIDLTNNRIHNPAMFELLKGITRNKTLSTLRIAQNPVTAPMTSIILQRIFESKECGLKELDLEGMIVDKEFDQILHKIQEKRIFIAKYALSLPVSKKAVSKVDSKNVFNIDPIRILYYLKEHMRTIDMFLKFDRDHNHMLSRDELSSAFEKEGYPISSSSLDSVMSYLDTNRDGNVDLMELIDGERRLKRQIIAEREEERLNTSFAPSSSEKKEYSKAYVRPVDTKSPRLKLPKLK